MALDWCFVLPVVVLVLGAVAGPGAGSAFAWGVLALLLDRRLLGACSADASSISANDADKKKAPNIQ